MNSIGHFEIPSSDVNKSKEFYSNLFDWEFNLIEEMNYLMIQTTNPDGSKSLTGGIYNKQNENQKTVNYINVKNVEETAKKIKELGGNIVVPKTAVPGMGWFVHFLDLDGNLMAIWENDQNAK